MSRITRKLTVVLIFLFALVLLASAVPAGAKNGVQMRPIEDFLNSQGTFCIWDDWNSLGYEDPCPPGSILFVPPAANFIGWTDPADPNNVIVAAMDYAGLANECAGGAFGTEMTGSITERPLADGRAEVHVRLQTTNALTFVAGEGDFREGPLLFGQRLVADPGNCGMLPEGTEPALGSGLLLLTFINSAPGAPLPDLIQLFVAPEAGQEPPKKISFQGQADGLRYDEESESWTPGRVEIAQTGLSITGSMGRATADGFPAERIVLRGVGQ